MTENPDDELDLSPTLKVGDVLISRRGVRWTVVGWTAGHKLDMRSPQGTSLTAWWGYRASLPKGWQIERNGTVLR